MEYISMYQKLSEPFIEKYIEKLDMEYISMYQKLSEPFMEKYKGILNNAAITSSWQSKTVAFKKGAIEKTKLYECFDEYFIAYKGIRSDRYSKFNFQYQYLKGNSYESFADFSNNESSFGLSVWTEEKATRYCSELVVKVKVRYEDIARVVQDEGKIRCTKIEILS